MTDTPTPALAAPYTAEQAYTRARDLDTSFAKMNLGALGSPTMQKDAATLRAYAELLSTPRPSIESAARAAAEELSIAYDQWSEGADRALDIEQNLRIILRHLGAQEEKACSRPHADEVDVEGLCAELWARPLASGRMGPDEIRKFIGKGRE